MTVWSSFGSNTLSAMALSTTKTGFANIPIILHGSYFIVNVTFAAVSSSFCCVFQTTFDSPTQGPQHPLEMSCPKFDESISRTSSRHIMAVLVAIQRFPLHKIGVSGEWQYCRLGHSTSSKRCVASWREWREIAALFGRKLLLLWWFSTEPVPKKHL